ncbi:MULTISPECIES: DUF6660 family protein [Aquirufa]|uniref:DUF6660 family protein n=1 Tax=Aquirufa TaxID=2676247 RepID=UPI00366E7957
MKISTLALSFYLLTLSCFACNELNLSFYSSFQVVSAENNHNHNEQNSEACTPFCNCSCCPSSAFYQPIQHFNWVIISFQSVKYPIYNSSFHIEVFYSIWQPPKLA